MHSVANPASPAGPAGPRTGARQRALIAAIAATAAITTGSGPAPASAQILSPPPITGTVATLLQLTRGVSPQKLKMIEEEGYLCFMAFNGVPPRFSWVCVPPLQ